MKINENIDIIARYADQALDDKDFKMLKRIAEDCYKMIESLEYSYLEKAILAYHGATSFSNYFSLVYNGKMNYSDELNNEAEVEFCIYLFRRSLDFFGKFRENKTIWNNSSDEERKYYLSYLHMAHTNYANELYQCGRLLKSISELKFSVEKKFPMAIGNMACKLIRYAECDYDGGHRDIFCNEAYQLLLKSLKYDLHEEAKSYFESEKNRLEKIYPIEFLENSYEFEDMSLGETNEEKNYRKWCLNNALYLNTLNDVFSYSLVANDCTNLPSITTDIDIGFKFHGLFNQLKQEYVSARYMIYDGINSTGTHYSDKEVYLYNTLDYPLYGLNIEKIKCAYRSLYSLFDRIAYLINDYFELSIKNREVSYKSIWERKKVEKDRYVDLKNTMTRMETYNESLIGLYWLFKDISKKKVRHDYLEPAINEISDIRNAIEHRYLKVHDTLYFHEEENFSFKDTLAKSVTFNDFKNSTIILLKYVREAIILLVMAVHSEEQRKNKNRPLNTKIAQIPLSEYKDEWKQIF